MKQKPTHCTRFCPAHSRTLQRTALIFAVGCGLALPAVAEDRANTPVAQIAVDGTTAQSSDLLLKMVIEAMLHLLEEIENVHDAGGIFSSGETLEEVAGTMIWGYENLGMDDNLSAAEILQGIDDGNLAMDILQDETQTLSIPKSVRDLLNSVVGDLVNDLETSI